MTVFAGKSSTTQIFFIPLLKSDNELPMSEMQKYFLVTDILFKIRLIENYPIL